MVKQILMPNIRLKYEREKRYHFVQVVAVQPNTISMTSLVEMVAIEQQSKPLSLSLKVWVYESYLFRFIDH